jgi:hypothetical protein
MSEKELPVEETNRDHSKSECVGPATKMPWLEGSEKKSQLVVAPPSWIALPPKSALVTGKPCTGHRKANPDSIHTI